MIRFLMVLCAAVAAARAYNDHEFFFDSSEHEYFSPSDPIRVTSGYGSGFYGSYSPTSYASEASSELSPLINSEIERIRSGRAAAAADSGSVEDYGGGNFKSDYGFGGFGSRDSREIDGVDFGTGSSYGSSFSGDTGAGLGLGAYSTDGGSGSRGARALYYPGLIGLGYGSGGYGGGSGEYGSGYGSGYIGSGGYDYGGAGAGLSGFGSGGYD